MGDSRSFGSKGPARPHLISGVGGLKGEIADLRTDVDTSFTSLETEVRGHVYPQAEMQIDGAPTEGDVVVIGDDTYEFVDAAGNGVVSGGIEVVFTDAADALTGIVAAINTLGTEKVVASVANTDYLHIEAADKRGGTPVPVPGPDIELDETFDSDDAVWNVENLNVYLTAEVKKVTIKIVVDADMLAGAFDIVVPFSAKLATCTIVTDAAGALDGTKAADVNGNLTPDEDNNLVNVDMSGGGAAPVATDIVYIDVVGL